MAHTFKKRGKTKYSDVSNLLYYTVSNPFDINSASGGNCTWYAWGRFWEVWASVETKYKTKRPTPVSKSNACYFYSDAKKNGYQVGLTPKPGAIICWGYNGSPHGNPGHVAFVEKVNKDGSIEISHSGWSSGPMENETLKRGNGQAGTSAYHRGYSNDYFNGFIYNPIDFGNPAGNISGKSKEWYISQKGPYNLHRKSEKSNPRLSRQQVVKKAGEKVSNPSTSGMQGSLIWLHQGHFSLSPFLWYKILQHQFLSEIISKHHLSVHKLKSATRKNAPSPGLRVRWRFLLSYQVLYHD